MQHRLLAIRSLHKDILPSFIHLVNTNIFMCLALQWSGKQGSHGPYPHRADYLPGKTGTNQVTIRMFTWLP